MRGFNSILKSPFFKGGNSFIPLFGKEGLGRFKEYSNENIQTAFNLLFMLLIISFSTAAFAEENTGKVLALKGKAVVERDKKKVAAKKNQSLL